MKSFQKSVKFLSKFLVKLLVILPLFAFSNNAQALTLREVLENEKFTIQDIYDAGTTVEKLLSEYMTTSCSTAEKSDQFLKKKNNKTRLKKLKNAEAERIAADLKEKAKQKKPKNKQFNGNAEAAIDADEEERNYYTKMKTSVVAAYTSKEINESTRDSVLLMIESLEHLHTNNRQISLELSQTETSETYGKDRLPLHTELKDQEFQLRAAIMFGDLKAAYVFAEKRGILVDMFNDVSRSSGCLENRLKNLSKWKEQRERYDASVASLSEEEKAMMLPDTATDALSKVIGTVVNDPKYLEDPEYGTKSWREKVAVELHNLLEGKVTLDGSTVTKKMAYEGLRAFLLSTPTPASGRSPSQDYLKTPPRQSPGQSSSQGSGMSPSLNNSPSLNSPRRQLKFSPGTPPRKSPPILRAQRSSSTATATFRSPVSPVSEIPKGHRLKGRVRKLKAKPVVQVERTNEQKDEGKEEASFVRSRSTGI